jgi:hypothetical protein
MRDIDVCIGPVNALRVSGEFKVIVSTLSLSRHQHAAILGIIIGHHFFP